MEKIKNSKIYECKINGDVPIYNSILIEPHIGGISNIK